MEKFESLVHFIISECGDPTRLGAIRLNKVLWYSDLIAYLTEGQSITKERYIKRQMGPVPARILATLEKLTTAKKIFIVEPEEKFEARKFISIEAPDTNSLSESNLRIVKHALQVILDNTASAVSESTHDIIWESAKIEEEIPFYATLARNVGKISDETLVWAEEKIQSYS